MTRISTLLIGVVCILTTSSTNLLSQCPEGSNVTANGFCFYATWDNPPPMDVFPNVVFSGGSIYTYQGGSGAINDPAVYKSGGGNGACNAGQSGFTGAITVGDENCIFQDGGLVGSQTLPVVLITYDVYVIDNHVEINWETSAEVNNEYFLVERTTDLENWDEIARVKGTNLESGNVEYRVIDESAKNGVSYYRLSQKDFDGEITPLAIRAVSASNMEGDSFEVFPNPASTIINFTPSNIELARVELIDSNGRLVSESVSGQNFLQLDGVAAGLYIIRATETSGTTHTRKVVVSN